MLNASRIARSFGSWWKWIYTWQSTASRDFCLLFWKVAGVRGVQGRISSRIDQGMEGPWAEVAWLTLLGNWWRNRCSSWSLTHRVAHYLRLGSGIEKVLCVVQTGGGQAQDGVASWEEEEGGQWQGPSRVQCCTTSERVDRQSRV